MTGKKNIILKGSYYSIDEAALVFLDENIKKVLIPWNVNLQASSLQSILVKAMKARPELKVTILCLLPQGHMRAHFNSLPGSQPLLVSN